MENALLIELKATYGLFKLGAILVRFSLFPGPRLDKIQVILISRLICKSRFLSILASMPSKSSLLFLI